MPQVDNDTTKCTAAPFVVIAQKRSGGTHLTHCLSNHPQIFCDRGESLHHLSIWRQRVPLSAPEMLDVLLHQEGYFASGCRLVYSQAFNKQVWRYLQRAKPRVIHLTRDNKLRQSVSIVYNEMVRAGQIEFYPVHTFDEYAPPPPVAIDPARVIATFRRIQRDDRRFYKALVGRGFQVLRLTYTDVVGGEGATSPCAQESTTARVCEFLGVRPHALCSDLRRVHSHPLRVLFSNWNDVERALSETPLEKYLEEEQQWKKRNGQWTT